MVPFPIRKIYVFTHKHATTIGVKKVLNLEESVERYIGGFGRRKVMEVLLSLYVYNLKKLKRVIQKRETEKRKRLSLPLSYKRKREALPTT